MPVELSRSVRFCVNPASQESEAAPLPRHNTFAAWPGMIGLGAFYELQVVCRGEVDAQTGYLMNITEIDRAVREQALPIIERAFRTQNKEPNDAGAVLAEIIPIVNSSLGGSVVSVRWHLTPYHSISMQAAVPHQLNISQHFEFSASHRLHVPSMSDEDNRRVFGKCNNPHGHGHNYRVEVTVAKPLEGAFTLATLERIVDQRVIQRFDHKHLNLDTAEFALLNPSVENIAKMCFDLLQEPINAAGGSLQRVKLWETEKTFSSYPVD